jgi:hypothetical protein
MSQNPLNLLVRFLLELCILAALGRWGWTQGGAMRWPLAILLPLAGAALWGVFRVPDDGGAPTVQVGGAVRLGIELLLFGAASAALAGAGHRRLAAAFAAIALLHYAVSYDRVLSLLREGRGTDAPRAAAWGGGGRR